MFYNSGPARLEVKIEKWSDLDENFWIYVTFDEGSESEVGFSVFFLKNREFWIFGKSEILTWPDPTYNQKLISMKTFKINSSFNAFSEARQFIMDLDIDNDGSITYEDTD